MYSPCWSLAQQKPKYRIAKQAQPFLKECTEIVTKGTYAWLPYADASIIKIDKDGDFAQRNRALHAAIVQDAVLEFKYFIENVESN